MQQSYVILINSQTGKNPGAIRSYDGCYGKNAAYVVYCGNHAAYASLKGRRISILLIKNSLIMSDSRTQL